MNVLILAKAFPPDLGGVETVSEQIAAAYARAGANVRVITQFAGPVGEEMRTIRNGSFHVLNVGPGPQYSVFLRMLRATYRLLSQQSADITHATTWRVMFPAIIAKWLGRKTGKLVLMIHGREVLQTRSMLAPLMRYAVSFADRALVISAYSKSACQEKLPALHTIGVVSWNGVSWPNEPRKSNGQIVGPVKLFAASRLLRQKNTATIIRALSLLQERHGINARLKIAGSGPERSYLEQLCESIGVEKQVEFLGTIDRSTLPEFYRSADIFVHPHSGIESFCIAVADAMALGIPTISGRDGAPPEYIVEGVNGFLVNGEDASELADIIAGIVRMDEEKRAAIGEEAAKFCARSFSWDRHIVPALELVAQTKY